MNKTSGNVEAQKSDSNAKRALKIYALALVVGWIAAKAFLGLTNPRGELHAVLPLGVFVVWGILFFAVGLSSFIGAIAALFGGLWARLKGERYYGEEIPLVSFFREANPLFAVFLLLTPCVAMWLLGAIYPHGF
jgi:hypothetical protein